VEWAKLCTDTDEEDWNFKSVVLGGQRMAINRMGNAEEGFFILGDSTGDKPNANNIEGSVSLTEDLVLAFVNSRGNYGNSALHLAVTHSRKEAITYLLNEPQKAKGRGRPSLTLMNMQKLTPLTLSVRMAQEKQENLESFEEILQSAYSSLIWTYGDVEMRLHSYYQMDTFRVRDKKLHQNPDYLSALEIVVHYEVPVLTALPVFEDLIFDKWEKFGFRYHMIFAFVPYTLFVVGGNPQKSNSSIKLPWEMTVKLTLKN